MGTASQPHPPRDRQRIPIPSFGEARVAAAYVYCQELARRHYENFPVASRLLPARLRRPVAAIYAYAREADDFADEGDLPAQERLARLDRWQALLDDLYQGHLPEEEPVFIALADVIARHHLPREPFADLLSAFRQDVLKRRYRDFPEVLDYCRRSANPVGRLVLHLAGQDAPAQLARSDCICTALQLLNFLQDIRQDYEENDRVYLPLEDLAACGLSAEDVGRGRDDAAMRRVIRLQLQRIRTLLNQGAALARQVRGRLGLELRITVTAAYHLTRRLETAPSCYHRPRLGLRDWGIIAARTLAYRRR